MQKKPNQSRQNASAFSILEVMVVAGLMSIVGLSITSVVTNTTKSQKRIEQKDLQMNTVNYVRGILQNPDFCVNAFCTTDVATCANNNINFLPTSAAAPQASPYSRKIYAIQAKLTAGNATTSLRCSSAASDGCNSHPMADFQPTSAPFGTPVNGVNGLFVYGMWLSDITFKGQQLGIYYSTARLLMQFATGTAGTAGSNLKSSSIDLYFKSDATGNITGCAAGAVDSKWQDSPTVPSGIYYTAGPVGIGVDDPTSPLAVEKATAQVLISAKSSAADTQISVNNTTGKEWKIGSAGAGSGTTPNSFYVQNFTDSTIPFSVLSGGNVGIGITNPAFKLDVSGEAAVGSRMWQGTDGTNYSWIGARGTAGDAARVAFGYQSAPVTGAVTTAAISTGGTVRVGVTNAGDVGIGTGAPGAKLDVAGNILLSGAGAKTIATEAGNSLMIHAPGNSSITLRNNGADNLTIASTGISSFANQVRVLAGGVNVTGLATLSSGVSVSNGATVAAGVNITSGNLTVAAGGTATLPILQGNIQHNGNLTGNGGDITAYNNYLTSDRRFKRDLASLPEQTSTLEKLGIYSFKFIDDPKNRTHFGLIAQEVQKYYPELILKTEDGKLNLNYVELIPLTIKSLQEAHAEIEKLKVINEEVTNENLRLSNTVSEILQQQKVTEEQVKYLLSQTVKK